MKALKRVLITTAAGCLVASGALAAINGSHHDMQTWLGNPNVEVCFPCHGVTDVNSATGNFGNVGALCVTRCHLGTGGAGITGSDRPIPRIPGTAGIDDVLVPWGDPATTTIDALDVSKAHGLVKANLIDDITGGAVTFDAIGLALPYASGAGDMECTSCHAVHSNTNTPFLHRDLFTGGPGGNTSFCEACHTARGTGAADWSAGVGAPAGEHPVNIPLTLGNALGGNLAGTYASRVGRYIQFDTIGGAQVMDVTSANGGALTGTAASAEATTKYRTGGKASWNGAGAGDIMGCYTCHAAHMPSDATIPVTTSIDNLVLRASNDGEEAPLCSTCHGDVQGGTDDANPGLQASQWYHPVGNGANPALSNVGNVYTYTVSTGNFTIPVDLSGVIGFTSPGGNTGVGIDTTAGAGNAQARPRCTSCHDVHGGLSGTMAIADLDGTENGALDAAYANICEVCHNAAGGADLPDDPGKAIAAAEAANVHHITNTGTDYTGGYSDADGNALTIDAASWGADLSDGLQCTDCHVFNGTAHNWD